MNTYEIHDTRDLAEALLDADTDEADRRVISELFEAFGIQADRPDDIDTAIIPERMFPEYVVRWPRLRLRGQRPGLDRDRLGRDLPQRLH